MSKLSKLVRHPGKFFDDAAKKKREYAKLAGVERPIFAFHINDWKRPILEEWLPGRTIIYVPLKSPDVVLEKRWLPLIERIAGAEVLVWGMNLPQPIKKTSKPIRYVEDGFIRSIDLGSKHTPPMSLNFDNRTLYFDAGQPSDLEELLNSHDFGSDPSLLPRARALIGRIVEHGVSKYNHCGHSSAADVYGPKRKPRVLVIGQVEDDASILYGCEKRLSNNDLVHIAYIENPEAEIIYKPHPDVLGQKRKALSNPDDVAGICRVVTSNLALADAFDTIDHVYTITSQAGFEALLRGIPVTTLGCPFYAGWGLTDDRQPNERRKRRLTLEEVFAAAFILYPRYYDPYYKQPITPEEAVDLIVKLKGSTRTRVASERSVNVRPRPVTFCVGIETHVRPLLEAWLPDREIIHLPDDLTDDAFDTYWASRIHQAGDAEIMIGRANFPEAMAELDVPRRYVGPGFLSSIDVLGGAPISLSLNVDDCASSFDASHPSDLERLLEAGDFVTDVPFMARAKSLMTRHLGQTLAADPTEDNKCALKRPDAPDGRRNILVMAQSTRDPAVRYGCDRSISAYDLVHIAYLEHPEANIYCRFPTGEPSAAIDSVWNTADLQHICTMVSGSVPLRDLFADIDHVYTVSSPDGFEAVMRGIRVTTLGCPFYSGWGVTDDRQPNIRRTRTLTVEQVFAGAYMAYPHYIDPFHKRCIEPEEAFDMAARLEYIAERQQDSRPVASPPESSLMPDDRSSDALSSEWQKVLHHLVLALERRDPRPYAGAEAP